MEWRLKKNLIPDGYVFKMNLPVTSKIVAVKMSDTNSYGGKTPSPQPYLITLTDNHDSTFAERTFVLFTEGREVSPRDAEQIRNGEMVFIGEFTLAVMTFYMFEDLSETA